MTWTPDLRGDETDPLSSAVHQAIGSASVCWESMSGTGVFDEKRAREIAAGLIEWLRDNLTPAHFDRHRSSVTGRFVPADFAARNPDTTEHEQR